MRACGDGHARPAAADRAARRRALAAHARAVPRGRARRAPRDGGARCARCWCAARRSEPGRFNTVGDAHALRRRARGSARPARHPDLGPHRPGAAVPRVRRIGRDAARRGARRAHAARSSAATSTSTLRRQRGRPLPARRASTASSTRSTSRRCWIRPADARRARCRSRSCARSSRGSRRAARRSRCARRRPPTRSTSSAAMRCRRRRRCSRWSACRSACAASAARALRRAPVRGARVRLLRAAVLLRVARDREGLPAAARGVAAQPAVRRAGLALLVRARRIELTWSRDRAGSSAASRALYWSSTRRSPSRSRRSGWPDAAAVAQRAARRAGRAAAPRTAILALPGRPRADPPAAGAPRRPARAALARRDLGRRAPAGRAARERAPARRGAPVPRPVLVAARRARGPLWSAVVGTVHVEGARDGLRAGSPRGPRAPSSLRGARAAGARDPALPRRGRLARRSPDQEPAAARARRRGRGARDRPRPRARGRAARRPRGACAS